MDIESFLCVITILICTPTSFILLRRHFKTKTFVQTESIAIIRPIVTESRFPGSIEETFRVGSSHDINVKEADKNVLVMPDLKKIKKHPRIKMYKTPKPHSRA